VLSFLASVVEMSLPDAEKCILCLTYKHVYFVMAVGIQCVDFEAEYC